MVRPNTLMLSVFNTPWVKPTPCQLATKEAVRSATSTDQADTIHHLKPKKTKTKKKNKKRKNKGLMFQILNISFENCQNDHVQKSVMKRGRRGGKLICLLL